MQSGCKSSAGIWSRLIAGAVLAGTSGFAAAEPSTTTHAAVAKVFAAFAQPGQPGCSVGARRDGALVHASAHGLADIAAGRKLSEQSVFNIAGRRCDAGRDDPDSRPAARSELPGRNQVRLQQQRVCVARDCCRARERAVDEAVCGTEHLHAARDGAHRDRRSLSGGHRGAGARLHAGEAGLRHRRVCVGAGRRWPGPHDRGRSAAVDRQLSQRTRRRARAREAHDGSRRAQVG
jgi:hypothetical protein